jgi:hypothetical protein
MMPTTRPASLPMGWRGAWALVARPALTAIRDDGPLTLDDIAAVLRREALPSDLNSAGGLVHGALALANAVLDDADAIITVIPGEGDGERNRYAIDPSVTEYVSPFQQRTLALFDPAAAVAATETRPIRNWMAKGVYSPFGGKWANGLPGRHFDPKEVDEMADTISLIGWQSGARIIKDQNGVIIDGFLRDAALRLLAIDPDTGVSRDGEPFVEIRSFPNDASRLSLALAANWLTMKYPTRKAIAKQVFGVDDLAPGLVKRLVALGAVAQAPPAAPAPTVVVDPVVPVVAPAPEPVVVVAGPYAPTAEDQQVLDALLYAERVGKTSEELDYVPGQTSSRLSRLCNVGLVVKLAERRGRCQVYVLPQFVDGRALSSRPRSKSSSTSRPSPTEGVGSMTWREAAPGFTTSGGRGRIYAYSGCSADDLVIDHVDGVIADLRVKLPWFLPLMCERLAGE